MCCCFIFLIHHYRVFLIVFVLLLLLNHRASSKTNPGPWCESLCHGITVTLEAKLKQKPLVDVVCEICEIKKTLFVLFCSMHRDRVSRIQKKRENKGKKAWGTVQPVDSRIFRSCQIIFYRNHQPVPWPENTNSYSNLTAEGLPSWW